MLLEDHLDDIAASSRRKNGKTFAEAKAADATRNRKRRSRLGIPMMMQGLQPRRCGARHR